jgi:hypothetical protein
MAGLTSKINQNWKLLEYADDVAVYSVNRNSKIGVSEVEKHRKYWTLFKVKWLGDRAKKKKKKVNCLVHRVSPRTGTEEFGKQIIF